MSKHRESTFILMLDYTKKSQGLCKIYNFSKVQGAEELRVSNTKWYCEGNV